METAFDGIGKGQAATSKWAHYFQAYDRHFERFRNTDVHLVELGIAHGGSLLMWRKYFGESAHLFGLDIANATRKYVGDPSYGRPDKVIIGNERLGSLWEQVASEVPRIDIFIDDGGHKPHHQIIALEVVLPLLRPGGIYLVEDIIDAKFIQHVHEKYVTPLTKFEWKSNLVQVRLSKPQQQLFSVSIYPGMVVIEKLLRPREILRPVEHGTLHNNLEGHSGR